jgi:GNAT superfamily N-acetyltransferase
MVSRCIDLTVSGYGLAHFSSIALDVLATHPKYQGRGAARLLIQWGLDLASKAGVEAYLEATAAGKPVYQKFGFESVKVVQFDLNKYGVDATAQFDFMIRPPPS